MNWQDVEYRYQGASVLVTGGTSGIGLAIAAAYKEAGADVTITGTKPAPDAYDADLSDFRYLQLDVTDKENLDATASKISKLDILVNNAGFVSMARGLNEEDPDVFDQAIQTHLLAPYRLARRLAPLLTESAYPGGASIIGIGSVTSFMGVAVTLGYGAGKTGLLGMTRGLATSMGGDNIRVNVVAPGLTQSNMTALAFENPVWTEPMMARTPLARLGKPEDVAGPVLFLTSSAASWITGQVLSVDGGYTIQG